MKRIGTLSVVLGCAVLLSSCSSFAYLYSDDYRGAGIRISTRAADAENSQPVNQWAAEFGPEYSAEEVGVWAANRLAREGRHDVLILVQLIAYNVPPVRGLMEENMWRISVYPIQPRDKAE